MKILNFWLVRKFTSFRRPFKLLSIIILVLIGILGYTFYRKNKPADIHYQTAVVEKGALINSISATGTITAGNKTNITSKVSGMVAKVYVTNGDKVVKGQKIAEVTLDEYARERQAAAWVAYLSAIEAVKDAKKNQVSADIQMWKDRQNLLDAETAYKDMVAGAWNQTTKKEFTYNEKAIVTKQFEEAKLAFESSETKYKNSAADINNTQTKVAAALRDYQENSATIVAGANGMITDLALAEGLLVSASTSTSTTTGSTLVAAQTVAKVNNPTGRLVANVSVSEIDVTNIKANQKVTLTLDAFEDKSFTGRVLAVNTSGTISSGVTAYPVTIILDLTNTEIYPNMAVTAEIITNIETDVLLVPSSALSTNNGQTTVSVMKDGKPTAVNVEAGKSNDSQTIITNGLNEGDEVVTAEISAENTSATTTNSVFGGFGQPGAGGTRIIRENFNGAVGRPGGF